MSVDNDQKMGDYVEKNKKALLALPKNDKLTLIKKNAGTSWSKSDMAQVNPRNVNAAELNMIIRGR